MKVLATTDVEPRARLDYWRDVVCATYGSIEAEPREPSFTGVIEATEFGSMHVARVRAGGQSVRRRASRPAGDCMINVQVEGTGCVSQAGRSAVLRPGDIALYDATRHYELESDGPNDQIVLKFPRQLLIDRNVHIESAVAQRCAAGGVTSVGATLARSLFDHDEGVDDDARPIVGLQLLDCLSIALLKFSAATPTGTAIETFDVQRVLNHVDQRVCDPMLSIASVADEFGVSTRWLQKVCEAHGIRLKTHIRQTRLARARLALEDPRRSHHSITRIANDFGFSHSSHFARDFKAEFGESPSAIRRT